MTRQQLYERIKEKHSFLCVGLDPDLDKIPAHLKELDDPIFEFNKAIIDATLPFAVAYKPNTAFYEALGAKGWESLRKTIEYLPEGVFRIADAKRGDIGNTSKKYAQAFFENFPFDAITLSPYMGRDSITPYLEYDRKWVILLASTSNQGSFDFQELMVDGDSEKLLERVFRKASKWGNPQNMMFVVGATRVETLIKVRALVPEHFLLIPGVGAQGGSLELVCKYGMNKQCGLLVNVSRSILYADSSESFAEAAAEKAKEYQLQMASFIHSMAY